VRPACAAFHGSDEVSHAMEAFTMATSTMTRALVDVSMFVIRSDETTIP
jgi:hypothetical protein